MSKASLGELIFFCQFYPFHMTYHFPPSVIRLKFTPAVLSASINRPDLVEPSLAGLWIAAAATAVTTDGGPGFA